MNISDFLSPSDAAIDVAAADKRKLLTELARNAAAKLNRRDEPILAALTKREELGSTGVGGGVAIPHARFADIRRPFGMLIRLKKPMEYDAVDGKPVDIVFLLLLPEADDGEQLGALASIARKLRDPAVTAALRQARDGAEMYRTLTTA
jgi:nitrogen PTS system EIIA component